MRTTEKTDKVLDGNRSIMDARKILKAEGVDMSGSERFRREAIALGEQAAEVNARVVKLRSKLNTHRQRLVDANVTLGRLRSQPDKEAERISLERDAFELEQKICSLQADFDNATHRLVSLNEDREQHRSKARQRLSGSLATMGGKLGQQAREAMHPDTAFLLMHPHRIPADARAAHNLAINADALAASIDGRGGHVLASFENAAGEKAVAVLRKARGERAPRFGPGNFGGQPAGMVAEA